MIGTLGKDRMNMRKIFLVLTVIGILTAPAMVAEASETTQSTAVVTESREDQNRTEERLLREAKRIAREIFKAQREAKKE